MTQTPTPPPSSAKPSEPFGDATPFSEPTLSPPDYTRTHHSLRSFARQQINTHILPYSLSWEASGSVPPSARSTWLQTGLSFLDIPAPYRPSSIPLPCALTPDALDPFHELLLADEKSRVDGGVMTALEGASVIGVPPILAHGTESQKARWLPGLFDASTSFCLGVTEPGGGSDVAGLRTTAVRDEGEGEGKGVYVVNGAKKWITGAPYASHMTTAVRTGAQAEGARGLSVLVVPLDLPGVEVRRIENSGQKAGGASWVEMEDVRVPVENLVGREGEGFGILMRNFNRERFALAVGCNRKARTCLSHAIRHACEREAFGKKLVESQVIRRKFAEVGHRVEAHWAWLEQIAGVVKEAEKGWLEPSIAGRVALAKVQGGQIVEMACREAQQVLGGLGYAKEGKGAVVEQISRDLRMLVVGGGSEEIISDLAIRQELMMARKRGWKL